MKRLPIRALVVLGAAILLAGIAPAGGGKIQPYVIVPDPPVESGSYPLADMKFTAKGTALDLGEPLSFTAMIQQPGEPIVSGDVRVKPSMSNGYKWEVDFTGLTYAKGNKFWAYFLGSQSDDAYVSSFELYEPKPKQEKVENLKPAAAAKGRKKAGSSPSVNDLMKITEPKREDREINLFFQNHLTVRGTVLAAGHTVQGVLVPVEGSGKHLVGRTIDHGLNWKVHFVNLPNLTTDVGSGRYYYLLIASHAPNGRVAHFAMEKIRLINADVPIKDSSTKKKESATQKGT